MGERELDSESAVVVTPEMVAAGIAALSAPEDFFETIGETATRIYRAMETVRVKEREDGSGPSQ